MTPERWQKVDRIFQSALERAPAELADFINEACGADDSLRREVEALLAADEQAKSLIEVPAYALAAPLIVGGDSPSLLGKSVGHYQIISLVGKGGMGEVYAAKDTRLGRKVALKLLPAEFTTDADRLRRFEREARAASALNHPNILTIYDIGEEGGQHFIAAELVEGVTVRQQLEGNQPMLAEALKLAIQIAAALDTAHGAGIVHRDIKPENVMVRPDGLVKVLDFGLAKLAPPPASFNSSEAATLARSNTSAGVVLGTVRYMSPEQARGEKVDARTDIFSLGVMLYELVAGHTPFEAATPSETIAAILRDEPPLLRQSAPAASRELEQIVSKALRKDREQRYQTSQDLLIDLKDLLDEITFAAKLERAGQAERTAQAAAAATEKKNSTPTSLSAQTLRGEIKRHKLGVTLALALLVIAALGLFFRFNRAPALTDKDTILLADIVNTTGDEVFDGTLKQAVAVHLGQSPFLNIFADERVRETLRLMNRSPDERVTAAIGREICQRQGLKALLTGSIASLGRNYVIKLEAINSQSGDVLAHEQVEANEKEQVLRNLGEVAIRLREKLGESLNSLQRFDVPLEQVTTSSLEALKAFTLGSEQNARGKYTEAIVSLKHAVELDPAFAHAYSVLARAYNNSGQLVLAAETAQKAFDLRERVTEREKLHIAAQYYGSVTGELHKEIETLELLTRTYPNDVVARRNLGSRYNTLGQFEQAIEELREAIRLNPDYGSPYRNLATAYLRLSRIDEARAMADLVVARGFDSINSRTRLFDIAFIQGDTAAMQQQIDWASRRPGEYEHLMWQAHTAQFAGQLRKSLEFRTLAFELAQQRNRLDDAGAILIGQAAIFAIQGNCRQSLAILARARTLPAPPLNFIGAASSYAQCGALAQSQAMIDELILRYPKDTQLNEVVVPLARAEIECQRGNCAKAIQILQALSRIDSMSHFGANHIRGQAWLCEGNGAEAAREFQKILDNQGWSAASLYYPLAHLGLARAAVLQGDTAKAHKSYQDFFTLWKDADANIPALVEARKEYVKLK